MKNYSRSRQVGCRSGVIFELKFKLTLYLHYDHDGIFFLSYTWNLLVLSLSCCIYM